MKDLQRMSIVLCCVLMMVGSFGYTVPPDEIFLSDFETGDTCGWDFTVPQQCTLCRDVNTVALWHFDEGSGQAISDASGWGHHLTLGPTDAVEVEDPQWSTGRFGSGLFFDSTDLQYATGTGSVTFASNQLTVELWVKPTGGSGSWGDGQIFTYGSINCYMTTSTGDNDVTVGVGDGSSWQILIADAGPVDLDDGAWHYLVMTYGGSTLAAYIDGSLADSMPATTNLGGPAHDFKVGGRPQNLFLDGWMDEVRMSVIARPAGEIAANWAAAAACQ